MKSRWYIGTFIIALTLLGALYQQQIAVPNQEIVLQFTDVDVASAEAQSTVCDVTQQLQALGADNIAINQAENGTLVISYYSNVDVSHIKTVLSKENVTLGFDSSESNNPTSKNSISYDLDVYEIQENGDADSSLNGTVTEWNAHSDRFLTPNVFLFNTTITLKEKDNSVKVALRVFKNSAIALDNNAHNIPEVRAGPLC